MMSRREARALLPVSP